MSFPNFSWGCSWVSGPRGPPSHGSRTSRLWGPIRCGIGPNAAQRDQGLIGRCSNASPCLLIVLTQPIFKFSDGLDPISHEFQTISTISTSCKPLLCYASSRCCRGVSFHVHAHNTCSPALTAWRVATRSVAPHRPRDAMDHAAGGQHKMPSPMWSRSWHRPLIGNHPSPYTEVMAPAEEDVVADGQGHPATTVPALPHAGI